MRLRKVKNAKEILNSSNYYIDKPFELKDKWQEKFNNNSPIRCEIGMGKGDFLIGMAERYPNINFVGIEKYESVLVRAVQKLEQKRLANVFVICEDAMNLDNIFSKELDTIYLNFSDPWPKKRHYKRRLTYRDKLAIYENCFKDKITIEMKTDNDTLFESTLLELNNCLYIFDEVYLDLWSKDLPNIKTEYEEKFGSLGYKIKYIKVHKNL